jgi:hypothetical protein
MSNWLLDSECDLVPYPPFHVADIHRFFKHADSSILKIHDVTPEDSGEYSCIAISELGTVITPRTVKVALDITDTNSLIVKTYLKQLR